MSDQAYLDGCLQAAEDLYHHNLALIQEAWPGFVPKGTIREPSQTLPPAEASKVLTRWFDDQNVKLAMVYRYGPIVTVE
ncbi:unnamed protein product [marine sediment metagenome]|uniref:Uncharacterized protein n=1 Tax=marine sediment metagenome TaxID=412755 RepID=X0UUT3_9ZZZZ